MLFANVINMKIFNKIIKLVITIAINKNASIKKNAEYHMIILDMLILFFFSSDIPITNTLPLLNKMTITKTIKADANNKAKILVLKKSVPIQYVLSTICRYLQQFHKRTGIIKSCFAV